jgi:tetratricopeptide (TPR) repeat protein
MICRARLSGTFIAVAALLVAPVPAPSEPRRQDATALSSGASTERQVAIGEEHLYRITLTAGECAEVIVEQRGIDVVVRARREGGADEVEFQEEVRRHGQERVNLVADGEGTYILAIATSHGVYSGTYAIRVAARRAATDSDRSMHEARRLRTTALGLAKAARFDEARHLLERAMTISAAERGPDDVLTGMLLHDLVGLALETRDDGRAEPLQRRALAIFDSAWGDGHPYSAMARLRVAILLHNAGHRAQAEALLGPATQLIESTLGTEHAWFATCLRAQASIRYNARDLVAAEEIYRRAIAILERVGASDTPAYAAALNNLGLIYADKQDLARAEEYYLRALALGESLEGTESHHISLYLQNLGTIARNRKQYAKALEYTTRALAMRQRILGGEHVDIAPLLNNLAILHRVTGDVSRAIDLFLGSLRIWEKTVGPYPSSRASPSAQTGRFPCTCTKRRQTQRPARWPPSSSCSGKDACSMR